MCAVAKSYQRCDILGEPFIKNGRMYVTIETPTRVIKNVRWYTDAEYTKMYSEKAKAIRTPKEVLGFGEAGYITIYIGNTYENLDWFKAEANCQYHKIWGWYTPSDKEIPTELPEGISTAQIPWDEVAYEGSVDENKAQNYVDKIRYANVESPSKYFGEIGARYTLTLTVTKALVIYGNWGTSTMHIMEDADGNVFVWTTNAKDLRKGGTFELKGTVKDHKEYRGVKQTILTRCTVLKELE